MGVSLIIAVLFCSGEEIPLSGLVVSGFWLVLAFPILNVGSSTLYAKAINPNPPGKFFGLYSLMFGFSGIVGPLASAAALDASDSHFLFWLGLIVVYAMCPLAMAFQWRNIKHFDRKATVSGVEKDQPIELVVQDDNRKEENLLE